MTREARGPFWVMKYGQYGLPLCRMPGHLLEYVPLGRPTLGFTPRFGHPSLCGLSNATDNILAEGSTL